MKKTIGLAALTFTLAGCGGGGGGSTQPPTQTTPQPNKPTVSISSDKSLVRLGKNESATLTWSSTDATSCTASGDWEGTKATSGNASVSPTTSGKKQYKLSCTGAGGTAEASVQVTVPIPVQATSYLNAKNLNIASQSLPMLFRSEGFYGKLIQDANGNWGYLNSYGTTYYFLTENAYGFADFFQDGSLSMVSVTTEYNPSKPRDAEEKKIGHIFFWKKDAAGNWVDSTSQILTDSIGCLHARKALIADFNKDGKPDVFVSCTGYDSVPFPGEKSRILLSQPNGKYSNLQVDATANGFSHGSSAADVNHDGNIDIVLADASRNSGATPIYFLMGNGDGTFVTDYNRVSKDETSFNPWFTVELIDIDGAGNYSIVAGGHEPFVKKDGTQQTGATTKIIKGDGTGTYFANVINIPGVNDFAIALDFMFNNGNLYILRSPMEPFYFGAALQKVNLQTMSSSLLYQSTDYIDKEKNLVWVDWIVPYQDKVVSPATEFKFSIPK